MINFGRHFSEKDMQMAKNYRNICLSSLVAKKCKSESWVTLSTSLVSQMVNRLSTMREIWVRSLGREDPLEKEMAIHSSTIAWKIPWTEEPGRLQSMGSQRVRHDWATSLLHHFIPARMAIIKRSDNSKSWWRHKGIRTLWVRIGNSTVTWNTVTQFFKMLNIKLQHDLPFPLLGIYQEEWKCTSTHKHTLIFTAALFMVDKI